MNLHDRIDQDLDRISSTGPDITSLTTGARARARRIRRRRGAIAGGAFAALAVGGLAVWALPLGGAPSTSDESLVATDGAGTPSAVESLPTEPADGAETGTRPATARGAAAALVSTLGEVTDVMTSGYAGQDPRPAYGDRDYFAQVRVDDGAGLASVEVNVQFDGGFAGGCSEVGDDCRSTLTRDGDRLTTYEVTGDKGLDDVRLVAELVRPDGVRVVVAATNSITEPGLPLQVTRTTPPLTRGQLGAIARRDYWNEKLPTEFLEAGRALEPFTSAS